MATYLDGIVAWHRSRAAADTRDTARLREEALESCGTAPARPFSAALVATDDVAVVAEVKRRSPSKGDLAPRLDPAALALSYERAGARCLSVLTDSPHFGGSPDDLVLARSASGLPVLRKDFTVSVNDVLDARLMGADAVLLIAAVLGDDELEEFSAEAAALQMAALVEVHDEAEAARAIASGASLVGVNQRDLSTFEVDTQRAVRVKEALPAGVATIAESGISSGDDVALLAEAGYDAVLVGERLVTAPDLRLALGELTGHHRRGARVCG